MKALLIFLGLVFIPTMLTAYAARAESVPTAQDFVKKASVAGTFEVESSKLALKKSQNQEVKDFAQKMIDDHSAANVALKETVKTSGLPDSAVQEKLDARHAAQLKELNQARAAAFDKKYVTAQVKAHDEAVELFSTYAEHGTQADLKEFAADTLPTLKQHQEHVNQLKANF